MDLNLCLLRHQKQTELLADGSREGWVLETEPKLPVGRYEVTITFSNRFGRAMPLIMGANARIHHGGVPARAGDILVSSTPDFSDQRIGFGILFLKIQRGISSGKVYIDVTNSLEDGK